MDTNTFEVYCLTQLENIRKIRLLFYNFQQNNKTSETFLFTNFTKLRKLKALCRTVRKILNKYQREISPIPFPHNAKFIKIAHNDQQ